MLINSFTDSSFTSKIKSNFLLLGTFLLALIFLTAVIISKIVSILSTSAKLYFSFTKMTITEHNDSNEIILQGSWEIELDVPEKMYNRTSETYRVVSSSNGNFEIYSSSVSDTGFEIGVIINNIERPEYPEKLREIQGEEWAEKVMQSPYKELYVDFIKKNSPINVTGINHLLPNITGGETKVEKGEYCYVENSNGEKFECTMSPSRRAKNKWLEGNKFDFYETFGMTKYDATDTIKVVLNYYGEAVTIELEKVK